MENHGEIKGNILGGQKVGAIYKNTIFGIYGNINDISKLNINKQNEIEVASREETTLGPAKILCTLENGGIRQFDIEIKKINLTNNEDNKSLLFKVTDKELLEKTGGIIQGMSGSPIIQNGKFIGAVTHVLVNDPSMGYGVFGDILIKTSREVK